MRPGFSLLCLFSLAGLTASVLAQPAPGRGYGPCCPLVKGQKPLAAHAATGGATVTGPRYTCATKPVTLAFNGTPVKVEALEATGSLLVPARLFALAGADLEWGGNRQFVLVRGNRRVELTLGSHAVTVNSGDDSQMVSWPLCPRQVNGISYAPLRPLAEALGLTVGYADGAVSVTSPAPAGDASAPAAHGKPAPGSCPADRVEAGLGVTVVRSPAESEFGVGAGLTAVKPEGLAAQFGAQPGDVVIGANDQPVKCPKDLDQLLTKLRGENGTLRTLVVARGKEKVTLAPKAAGQ